MYRGTGYGTIFTYFKDFGGIFSFFEYLYSIRLILGGMKNFLKFKNNEGVRYEIIFRKPDARTWGEDCDGVCFYPKKGNKSHIYINPHRSNQTILNTVIHEVTHAYFPELTEKEVTSFGNTLSRVLYNNLQYRVDEDA